jgi:hypothetical protein
MIKGSPEPVGSTNILGWSAHKKSLAPLYRGSQYEKTGLNE